MLALRQDFLLLPLGTHLQRRVLRSDLVLELALTVAHRLASLPRLRLVRRMEAEARQTKYASKELRTVPVSN